MTDASSLDPQSCIDALPDGDEWAVQAADLLLRAARQAGCSDLHLLCRRDAVLARGRREGTLIPFADLPVERRDLLIARFKVLARLPAFIRHEPQDGRIEWRGESENGARILRASFLPTLHGENVVVRFPVETTQERTLEQLGMPTEVLEAVDKLLGGQEGAILLTGPSSSGKTTTLYAMMRRLYERHGDRLNFLSIEDPVEHDLGFAGQVQVNEARGLTFERALRAGLRQDPNVLMIGEIRDLETARTALQAGMTGHLVLSTIHAGRANRTFSRLLSLGVSRYQVASALNSVMAQRLARVLCPSCSQRDAEGYVGAGCTLCAGTGYRGRTALFEQVVVTESLRNRILSDATPEEIAAEAARSQIGGLVEQGRKMLAEGTISRLEFEYLFASETPEKQGQESHEPS